MSTGCLCCFVLGWSLWVALLVGGALLLPLGCCYRPHWPRLAVGVVVGALLAGLAVLVEVVVAVGVLHPQPDWAWQGGEELVVPLEVAPAVEGVLYSQEEAHLEEKLVAPVWRTVLVAVCVCCSGWSCTAAFLLW